MTVHRLSDSGQECFAYTIIGQYSSTPDGFVGHVAILPETRTIRYDEQDVQVWHTAPPVVSGPLSLQKPKVKSERRDVCTAHLAGAIDLEPDEVEGIKTWLYVADQEDRPAPWLKQYTVKPHMKVEPAEKGRSSYRRFSCAGFVVECYAFVGIDLVQLPDDRLPEVDISTVITAYPDAAKEGRRAKLGIPGQGPWRILLAGYIFHSLNRDTDVVRREPYLPPDSTKAVFRADQASSTPTRKSGLIKFVKPSKWKK